MSLYNRPNGSSDFADDPAVDPATGAKMDAELNGMVAIINSMDNANISGTPKIAASKVDLSSGGYVNDTGDEMTGALEHVFDGIWRKMRASGNGRIYESKADALWCLSYNTEYSGGSWQGRDVTGVCFKITIESDGIHFYSAVSASSGTVPTWVQLLHSNLTNGNLNIASGGVIGANTVNQISMIDDAVGQAELSTAGGSVSTTQPYENLTLPGGAYGFYPMIKMGTVDNQKWLANMISGFDADNTGVFVVGWTSLVTNITLGENGTSTMYAQQQYVIASPPYNLGNGDIPIFIYASINNSTGEVESTYIAEDPPWAYNGPKRINPRSVIKRNGKKYLRSKKRPWSHAEARKNKTKLMENLEAMKTSVVEEIEITQAMKNVGMPDVPHPFASLNPATHTVVLLDPVSSLCLNLQEMSKESNEGTIEISDLLYERRIKIGNTSINGLITPPGVMGVKMRLG